MADIEPGSTTKRPLTIYEKREIIKYRMAEGKRVKNIRDLTPRMSAYFGIAIPKPALSRIWKEKENILQLAALHDKFEASKEYQRRLAKSENS